MDYILVWGPLAALALLTLIDVVPDMLRNRRLKAGRRGSGPAA